MFLSIYFTSRSSSAATVRHDWESWRSVLSPRGVALIHNTATRDPGFGVWRLWVELREQYPSFSFVHGHGLGILATGPDAPPEVLALCALTPADASRARAFFAVLGTATGAPFQMESYRRAVEAELLESRAEAAAYREAISRTVGARIRAVANLRERVEKAEQRAIQCDSAARDAQSRLMAMQASTSWRLTAPLRRTVEIGGSAWKLQVARLTLAARAIVGNDSEARRILTGSLRRRLGLAKPVQPLGR
jgi:hypothetical protein